MTKEVYTELSEMTHEIECMQQVAGRAYNDGDESAARDVLYLCVSLLGRIRASIDRALEEEGTSYDE